MIKILLSLFLGYLFGSISFAVLISRLKGVDIRKVGTGNPGAANVFRQVGKPYGIAVWVLDTVKGVVPMFIAHKILHLPVLIIAITGALAIAGHCWSLFLKFKGGKGVATMGGVTLYLMPLLFPLGAILYFWVQGTGRKPVIIYSAFTIFFIACYLSYRFKLLFLFSHGKLLTGIPWLELVLSMIILLGVAILANIPTIKELKEQWGKH
ncbi:glycerol-3-phosphate acyltransferase [Candidatus Calescamantes bacterium]|nr:glycerol-3-phosphate acyltransferase [Candidatus Calescamantes bacterium]